MQQGLSATLSSIAVMGAFLLAAGGIRLLWRGERQKGLLMIAAAVVLLANVVIWSLPTPAT